MNDILNKKLLEHEPSRKLVEYLKDVANYLSERRVMGL